MGYASRSFCMKRSGVGRGVLPVWRVVCASFVMGIYLMSHVDGVGSMDGILDGGFEVFALERGWEKLSLWE